MLKSCALLGVGLVAALGQARAQTQSAAKPTYMQIFYEGAGWVTGRPVVHYSPAFQGKAGEIVREDSTQVLSPGEFLFVRPTKVTATTTAEVTEGPITIGNGATVTTYVRGKDGKLRPQTLADRQQERNQEKARFERQLNLVAARATLARTTLTNALNATAADGWEVVQMASWGGKDGLVYLLRRR